MDRELAFGLLVLLVCGPVIWISAVLPGPKPRAMTSGRLLERRTWKSIWLRLLPSCVVFAALLGWAFQEPEPTGESVLPTALLLLVPIAIVWIRAAIRAALALVPLAPLPAAATVGVLRPRVVVAKELFRDLDPPALGALCAHEEAHARHRDPLRIWIVQLVSDLQWPWPAARSRLHEWLRALELARDEEARLHGVDGADLAAAVVAAARLGSGRRATVSARLTGDGEMLEARVARLLMPLRDAQPASGRLAYLAVATTASILVGAFLFGVHYGETVIQALPGVARAAYVVVHIAAQIVV